MLTFLHQLLRRALLATCLLAVQPAWAGCDADPGGPPGCAAAGPASPAHTSNADAAVGNPLNVITGNKYQREVDLPALPGVLGLEIVRHYNSTSSGADAPNGLVGRGWKLSYQTELLAIGSTLQILQADGARLIFNRDPSNPSQCSSGDPANGSIVLTRNSQGREESTWTWTNGRKLSFNSDGKLVQVQAPSGEFLSLQYDSVGVLVKVIDPQGRSLTLSYLDRKTAKAEGRYAGVQHIDSPVGRFRYDYGSPAPKGSKLADPRVLWATLVGVHYPGAKGTPAPGRLYHYENADFPTLLTGISVDGADKAGAQRYATYGYDDAGRAVLSTHANGAGKVTLEFRGGDTTVLTNSLGRQTVYRHAVLAGAHHLLEVRGAGCVSCGDTDVRYSYDKLGRLVQTTHLSPAGEPLRADIMERDDFGRVTKASQVNYEHGKPGQPQWLARYAYPASGAATPTLVARPSVVAGRETVTRLSYNGHGQPLKVSERGWTPALRAGAEPQPIERGTRYRYSMVNNRSVLTQVTAFGPVAGGQTYLASTDIQYDGSGNFPTEVIAPGNQRLKIIRRDPAGRPLGMIVPGGLELAYELDPMGHVTKLSKGAISEHFSYNGLGQLAGIVQSNGQRIAYAYAADGRLSDVVDAQGNRIRLERDTEARLIARTLFNPDGSIAVQAELAEGMPDPEAALRQAGLVRERPALEADAGKPNAIVGPDEAIRQISYDRLGRLTQLSDPRRLNSSYVHDDFGRLSKVDSPDGGVLVFTYDAGDHLLSKTSAFGTPAAQTVTYLYDAAGRGVEQLAPEGRTSVVYGPAGRPVKIAFPGGEERYEYDSAARLTGHTRVIDGQSFTTRYAYNELGQLVRKTLPDGQLLGYQYNGSLHPKAGLLASITRQDLMGKTVLLQGLNEAQDGYTKQQYQLAHGIDFVREADRRGQLVRIGSAGLWEEQQQRDALGRLTRRDPVGPGTERSAAYAYDALGRLTGMARGGQDAQGYGYDANGNLLAHTAGSRLTRYQVDPFSNRILSTQTDGVVQPYAYNGAGSVTQAGGLRYSWDSQQRLVRVSDAAGATIAEYAYNAFGERIRKISYHGQQKMLTYYFYEGGELVAEAEAVNGAPAITRQYVWLADQAGSRPIAMLQTRAGGMQAVVGEALKTIPTQSTRAAGQAHKTDVFAIIADHTGAPRAMVNDQQQVVWKADVTGFGRSTVAAGSTAALNMRGSNQYFDEETQLHYNMRRYLDPATGRYLSADPSGLSGGENLYAFADNDPLGKVDPMGLRASPAGPVTGWSFAEKVKYVLERVADKYPGELGDALRAMVSPTAIATTAAIFAIWQAAQFTPYGWAADVALAGIGYLFVGKAIWDVISGIYDSSSLILNAKCEKDLQDAGDILAKGFGSAVAAATGAAGATGASKIAQLVKLIFKDSTAARNAATTAAITQSWYGKFVPGKVRTGASANADHIARRGAGTYGPWKPMSAVIDTWLNPGQKIYMVNNRGTVDPGGWATPRQYTSLAEARRELALLEEFKPGSNCCVLQEYTVTAPIPVRSGTAGPLTSTKPPYDSYPGGAPQWELMIDRSLNWRNFLNPTGTPVLL